MFKQVIALIHLAHITLDGATGGTDLEFKAGHGWFAGRHFYPFQIEISIGPCQTPCRYASYGDFLHQLLVVGIQRIEAMHLVVQRVVRCRVTQNKQRIKFSQRLQGFCPFELLRLIEDHDGLVGLDDIDRAPGLEIIQLFIDPASIGTTGIKRLHVDNHDVDTTIGGETLQLMQLLGVVDKEPGLFLVILLEVLCGNLQRLVDTFTNGNAGHHNNELAPAILAVQLKNGPNITVRLTRTGLHLDIQVELGTRMVLG